MPVVRRPRKPGMHGRDHVLGGADPIPFTANSFEESTPIHGSINRTGAAADIGITSGFLNATTTLLQHDTIGSEAGVECDIVSTPSRITIIEPGLYLLELLLVWPSTGSSFGICISRGLNTTSAVWSPVASGLRVASQPTYLRGLEILSLDEGDYLTQTAGQSSGSTVTSGFLAHLAVARIPGSLSIASIFHELDGGSP